MERTPPRKSRLAGLRTAVSSLLQLQRPGRERATDPDLPLVVRPLSKAEAPLQPSLPLAGPPLGYTASLGHPGRQEPLGAVRAHSDAAVAPVGEMYTVQTVNGVLCINDTRWDLDTAATHTPAALDAIAALPYFPQTADGAAQLSSALHALCDGLAMRRRRARRAVAHTQRQMEVWRGELCAAEVEVKLMQRAAGVVMGIILRKGLPVVEPSDMDVDSIALSEDEFVEEEEEEGEEGEEDGYSYGRSEEGGMAYPSYPDEDENREYRDRVEDEEYHSE